jgi:hypothetical protein
MAINKIVPFRCCSHLQPILNPDKFYEVIADCLDSLRPHADKFDAIAISGYSMALIAPVIAYELGKGMIVVRKTNDDCASQFPVEGVICDSYIIIDDLVCSRDTLDRVRREIRNEHHSPAKLYGIYLYKLVHSSLKYHEQFADYEGVLLLNSVENIDKQLEEGANPS